VTEVPRVIYPIGATRLYGLVWRQDRALSVDAYSGFLLEIDPSTEGVTVLNPHTTEDFEDVTGLACTDRTFWVVRGNTIYYALEPPYALEPFIEAPQTLDGIAVSDGGVYVSSQEVGKIFVFGRATRTLLRVIDTPGTGFESLTLHGEDLWVGDRDEQTVYCLDPKTGQIRYRALTPFADPVGLAFWGDRLYVTYTGTEPYIRDNPNDPEPLSVQMRDRTFLHQLQIQRHSHFTLSNGFLVEMIYIEELDRLEQDVTNLTWHIALPAKSDRQTVRHVQPLGHPFTIEHEDGQPVAVFAFDHLQSGERRIFGWKALLELRSIKYEPDLGSLDHLPPPPPEIQELYLSPDGDLSMDHPDVRTAARAATQGETNIIRKMLAIREYVYDQLEYRLQSLATDDDYGSPDVVLKRGTASCGEYVRTLLALARLNGIACRDVGCYKCPPQAELHHLPLYPEYNHYWIEFYVPGYGWLPMESNPDDTGRRPYPQRWFMGLPWFHVEIGKGIRFESISDRTLRHGDLARELKRFKILEELS